jgi:amidohydrolase
VDAKQRARAAFAQMRDELIALSEALHGEPELAWEEHESSRRVADVLRGAGFEVEHPAFGLPTALRATCGTGPLHVGFCAEYDALPEVGHACGHNLIAAASVGAAIAAAAVADELGLTVEVAGTPAEERDGGKIDLLERGAFDGWHAALMVHPSPIDLLAPDVLGASGMQVRFVGVPAHAVAGPEDGVNAADAMVVAQVALGLLRQQLPADWKVSGYVEHAGEVTNSIPALASARYLLRTPTPDALPQLRRRVAACFEAGAVATGARLELEHGARPYEPVRHDPDLVRLFAINAFSTDMGNVSQRVPAIHPLISLDAGGAVNHSAEFAAACVGASAERALEDGALALAWTAIDAAGDEFIRARLLERHAEVPA